MADCKHRWHEADWGRRYRVANVHIFYCMRCFQTRLARLIGSDE